MVTVFFVVETLGFPASTFLAGAAFLGTVATFLAAGSAFLVVVTLALRFATTSDFFAAAVVFTFGLVVVTFAAGFFTGAALGFAGAGLGFGTSLGFGVGLFYRPLICERGITAASHTSLVASVAVLDFGGSLTRPDGPETIHISI